MIPSLLAGSPTSHRGARPRRWLLPAVLLVVAASAPAQELRRGVMAADAVVVGQETDRTPAADLVVHHLAVLRALHGTTAETVAVLDDPRVSLHERPTPGDVRLYCLRDASDTADRLGLPLNGGPYYRLVGAPGSDPIVKDPTDDPMIELTQALLQARASAPARTVIDSLLRLIEGPPSPARIEAVQTLTEWARLGDALDPLEISRLVTLAVAETDDVPFKIALCEFAAERRVDGLVDALCPSLADVADPRFAEALGRIARLLHESDAARVLRAHLLRARSDEVKGRLLLALGATSTKEALDILLDWRREHGPGKWIDAALRAHGAKQAIEAVGKKKG